MRAAKGHGAIGKGCVLNLGIGQPLTQAMHLMLTICEADLARHDLHGMLWLAKRHVQLLETNVYPAHVRHRATAFLRPPAHGLTAGVIGTSNHAEPERIQHTRP
mmetsp:Transcript_38071/g.81089  ORF Transcript_38071/g.81089 Transcript_38071/m.81089 type:complete len:104 (-) Transcript_38071:176-487(-)